MKNIVIVAGGTGGHIYPALALANELQQRQEQVKITFYGASDRMEATLFPQHGYSFVGLHVKSGKGLFSKIVSILTMLQSFFYCVHIFLKNRPDVVIGFGNYISVPVVLAGYVLKIPTMIHEQNQEPGKANLFLGKFVDMVVVSFSSSLSFFKNNARYYGNPQSTLASQKQFQTHLKDDPCFDKNKPLIGFMMGSLGSSSVSKIIDQACDQLKDFNLFVVSGKANDYNFTASQANLKIVPYIDGVQLLKECDLCVCRAGATTLAEIASCGTCTILIPSPYVPNNHQYYNALALSNVGGARLIEEKDLTSDLLANTILSMFQNPAYMQSMRENVKTLAKNDAARLMVEWIEEFIHG